MEREKGLWFSGLEGWWGRCKMFCVLFPLLHFALVWRLCSEWQRGSLSLLKSPGCCSSKTQLPEIHLDIYMLCPIISSSRRNFSTILFQEIMPPIGFLFFKSLLLLAEEHGSVCSNLLEIRRAIISPVYLSFRRDLKYTLTESSLF